VENTRTIRWSAPPEAGPGKPRRHGFPATRGLPGHSRHPVAAGQTSWANVRCVAPRYAEPVDMVERVPAGRRHPARRRDAVAIGANRSGWQLGIWSDEAASIAAAGGLDVVMGPLHGIEVQRLIRR